MASCPFLSTYDGKLILSTNLTADGTFVVIGCSGFGRQKAEPYNVICQSGTWLPEPTEGCETGFDDRERLLLGVFVACGVLSLIVLLLLCCSCCFFRRRRKFYGWWGRRWSGDRILIDRGSPGYTSYPRDTIIRRETIRPDYGGRSIGKTWRSSGDFGRTRRYSGDFDRMRSTMYPNESIIEKRETFRESYRPPSDFERRGSYEGPRGRTQVFKRDAYLPDYDFFDDKLINNRNTGWQMKTEEIGRTRRYSDGLDYAPQPQPSEYKRSRRYSDGSAAMMDQWRSQRRVVTSSAPMYYESVEPSPTYIQYASPPSQTVVQPIMTPIVQQEILEAPPPVVKYVEKPPVMQYVEKPPVTYNYTATYLTGGEYNQVVVDDEDDFIMKYDKFGMSYSTLPSLPRANITELPDSTEMKLVPFRSSQVVDPTSYYLGRGDDRYDSWYA